MNILWAVEEIREALSSNNTGREKLSRCVGYYGPIGIIEKDAIYDRCTIFYVINRREKPKIEQRVPYSNNDSRRRHRVVAS